MKDFWNIQKVDTPSELGKAIQQISHQRNFFLALKNQGDILMSDYLFDTDINLYIALHENIKTKLNFRITKGVDVKIEILSLLSDNSEQELRINTIIDSSNSSITFNSISFLKDRAKRSFFYNTQILSGSRNLKFIERDEAVMLSPETQNISIPALYSAENDADCRHQFYAGKINKQQIDFLAARGVDKKEALLLLGKSKVAPEMRDYFLANFELM